MLPKPCTKAIFGRMLVVWLGSVSLAIVLRAADWPQWRGPNRDAVWNETGILQTFPVEGLKIRWRAPIGAGHSSPIVAQGRVYVTASAVEKPKTWERVHCFDERTGEALWTFSDEVASQPDHDPNNPVGPVPTPIAEGDRVFALGATSHLLCLDARKGALIWQKHLAEEYDSFTSPELTPSPLIENGLVIVVIGGKPHACVVAFDQETGKEAWRALDDPPHSFSAPIVITAGGQRQLIVWTPKAVTSLNPATGETWWREEIVTHESQAVATPVCDGDRLLISGLMFRLARDKPAATVLWPQSKAQSPRILSSVSMPMIIGDHVFAGRTSGQLICLDAHTGKLIWETDKVTKPAHCATLHLTHHGDSVLIFTDQGNLIRARLSPTGYEELSRTHLLDPTFTFAGRKLVWAPPAFANRHVFARNDRELVCASLTAEQ